MFEYTQWIEETSLSVWIREGSVWAFPIVLIFHTVGLAFLVGANVALDVRMLGFARGLPLHSMLPFFKAMWLGFWVNAASGVLLLITYPTKALTNPLFYVKLGLIAVAVGHAMWVRRQIIGNPAFTTSRLPPMARIAAVAALVCWAAAITAGRLLAYTYSYLMAYEQR
jgi:hypothetical protein